MLRAVFGRRSVDVVFALCTALACTGLASGCGGPSADPDAGVDASGPPDTGPDRDAAACGTPLDCDDGLFCNGVETCVAGRCGAGPVMCDDDVACTIDGCDEDLRTCTFDVPDVDEDGATDARCLDALGVPLGTDCADDDANTFPGNTEVCDDHDEDCDSTTTGGPDADLDGYRPSTCCNPGATASDEPICGLDCDDTRANVSRLASEVCDGIDNNCNDETDEGVLAESWPDVDLDGFGDASATPDIVCMVPSSRANEGGDCNDADRRVHPFQTEECNGVDDDCDMTTDEGGTAACGYGLVGTTAICMGGGCVITGCAADRFDCNGIASDGCEPLCTSSLHCGSCGHECRAPLTSCGGGHCPGIYFTLGTGGILTDRETGAGVGGATITTIGTCTTVVTTTGADGSWELDGLSDVPRWVRIEAPGYPTHVQEFGGPPLTILPSSLVDAWAADPDAVASRSPERAIVVVDTTIDPDFIYDGLIGAGNGAEGTDLVSGRRSRQVFFDALPGHLDVGGSSSDGTGFYNCGPVHELWLEAGAVTTVHDVACIGVCS